MALTFISAVFKLHNPSARRREVLDYVLTNYTIAMDNLLEWSRDNLETILVQGTYRLIDQETGEVKSEKYTEKSISQILPSPSSFNTGIASCLKEAMVKNTASMLASYLELNRQKIQVAGFPLCRDPDPAAWPNALSELCSIGNDLDAEKKAVAKMMTVAKGEYMPVNISRSRDFAILTDKDRSKFFVWLKLLGKNSELITQNKVNGDNLIIIAGANKETGQAFSYSGKGAMLFPIEVGKRQDKWAWQYKKFIEPLLSGDASIKAAKLVKKGEGYFLHVSVGFEKPETYEPETYLGIDRGMTYTAAYGLVDKDGRIIEMAHHEDPLQQIRSRAAKRVQRRQQKGLRITRKDYKQRELDGIIHRLVNDILDKAIEHKAMIVMEDLNIRNVGKFTKSVYSKVASFLEYKAAAKGVPIYKRRNESGKYAPGVWAAYTSMLCIRCGEKVERSRDRLTVTCLSCGKVEHADEAAGVNIARRALYRAKDWGGSRGQKGDYFAFHKSFANGA